MTRNQLREMVRSMLDEANATNVGGATFTAGTGAQFAVPLPKQKGQNGKATKYLSKMGWDKKGSI